MKAIMSPTLMILLMSALSPARWRSSFSSTQTIIEKISNESSPKSSIKRDASEISRFLASTDCLMQSITISLWLIPKFPIEPSLWHIPLYEISLNGNHIPIYQNIFLQDREILISASPKEVYELRYSSSEIFFQCRIQKL